MVKYPISVIVSVITNRLMCDFDDYRAFLNYMTGTTVPLYDIARARGIVAAAILDRLPAFKRIDEPSSKSDNPNNSRYIKAVSKQLGVTEIGLRPLPGKFVTRTPIEVFA